MGFQINQVVVSGNLTRDPESRATPSGMAITSIGIAHNERRKNQQTGDWEDRAHFFDVTIFGGQGDWLAKNARKGDPVTVAGQLSWRSWEDKEGNKRSAVEVVARDVVLGQRAGNAVSAPQGGYQGEASGYGAPSAQSAVSAAQAQPAWSTGGGIGTAPAHPAIDPGEEDIPF